MDFFQQQENARRQTRLLLLYFFLLVVLISLLCGALLPLFFKYDSVFSSSGDCLFLSEILRNALVVASAILLLSFFGYLRYRSGGGAGIAESMGGRLLTRESAASLGERRLLNVVEEMALAAGMAVPPVYLLDGEKSINAFAAGLTPESAVIGITKGAVENFSRSELQGVVAHEFSHILNGDMRLNLRLAGMIFGLYCVFRVGQELLSINRDIRFEGERRRGGSSRIVFIALLFFCIGAAVARQREYLADASAVQFTRDNNTIGGALKRLLARAESFKENKKLQGMEGEMLSPKARELGYMMFTGAGGFSLAGLLADHPPLKKRILAIDPHWDGSLERWLLEQKERKDQKRGASILQDTGAPGAGGGSSFLETSVLAALNRPVDRIDRQRGRQVKGNIPKGLRSLASQGSTARLIPLLLAFDPNERNRKFLQTNLSAALLRILTLWEKCELAAEQRLALLDLALPTLKQMSGQQIRDYLDLIDRLVNADGRLILREWVVVAILHKSLDPQPLRSPRQINIKKAVQRLVLSLANAVQGDAANNNAVTKAKGLLGLTAETALPPPPSWHELEQALAALALQRPAAKKRLLQGCLQMISDDGRVTGDALELFRAIATLLEVPVAPPEQED